MVASGPPLVNAKSLNLWKQPLVTVPASARQLVDVLEKSAPRNESKRPTRD